MFIDDSGSGGDSPWVVMAGYIAAAESWDGFEDWWVRVLHDNPRIECFHAFEAESLRPDGPWAGIRKDDRDLKIDRLIEVIQRFDLQPISVRMRQSDYLTDIKGKIPPYWDDPYFVLFNSLVVQLSVLIPERFPAAGPIEIVFDNHEKFKIRGPKFYEGMRVIPTISETIQPNVFYENDEDFPGLQAADLLAWQIRRAFSVTTEARRGHYDAARAGQKGHPLFEFILTKEHMIQYIRVWDEHASQLAVDLGYPPETRPWKKGNRK